MANRLKIDYCFRFRDGRLLAVPLLLDEESLALVSDPVQTPPAWTELAFQQCTVCPLSRDQCHCPIALQLSGIVESFKDHDSFEEVTVEVSDSQRRYLKETSLQNGLGPLIGIVMATGGCPVMEPLRPLVRFHLPFASMEETEFRIVSMYLVAQYFRTQKGETPDWSLAGLQTIYDRVQEVNRCFAERLRGATSKDASINAIIILDCFARGVPFAVRTTLRDYEKHFDSYLH
jgi:hypothetical protein